MKTFAITNIQRRTVSGSFIGLARDVQVEAADDGEALSQAVRIRIGGAGTPSYSWTEVVEAAAPVVVEAAPTAVRTEDLGLGWFASLNSDGGMTVRNCDAGQRIDLTPESVERLRHCSRFLPCYGG